MYDQPIDEPTLPLEHIGDHATGIGALLPVLNGWGSFRLLARVGFGGFGEVYRAWDPDLEREVALKLLLPDTPANPSAAPTGATKQDEDQYKALLREARALASVVHPNIVRVYGIDRHNGRVGFWTDFVRGKTLSVLLGSQGAFGYREAAMIGLDLTRALAAVHRAGLLHRDIKAENVMREEGGRILLMDFGLSTLSQRQTNIAGTPNYMAPELWQGAPGTVASDIYAMGVLLYLMVANDYPVRLGGLSPEAAIAALERRRPLMDLRSDLPESYLRLVAVAMETDPAKRFHSAGELAAALSECLGTGGTSIHSGVFEVSQMHIGAALPPKKPRRMVVVGAAALVVMLGFGLAATRLPSVWRVLHIASGVASSGVSPNTYDQYLKAQDLLLHSYKTSNLVAAAKGFRDVLAADPTFSLAEAGLGRVYFIQYNNSDDAKLLDESKAAIAKAIELDPNDVPAYVTLARISNLSGNTALASQQVEKAIALDPNSADAYGTLAEIDDSKGRAKEAVEAIEHAIDLAPDDWRWPVRLGEHARESGDLKLASEQFQRAIELTPDNPVAYFDLGIVEIDLGHLEQAKSHLEQALNLQKDSDTYSALGNVSMAEGKFDEAADFYRKALNLDPNSYQSWGNLAAALSWSGQHDRATEANRKAIALAESVRRQRPDDSSLLMSLSNYYASVGDGVRTGVMIRRAIALSPTDPKVQFVAGDDYELLGQRSRAIPLLADALSRGYGQLQFNRSPELAALRTDPAFQAALADAKAKRSKP